MKIFIWKFPENKNMSRNHKQGHHSTGFLIVSTDQAMNHAKTTTQFQIEENKQWHQNFN
jgi:hypothetical protein